MIKHVCLVILLISVSYISYKQLFYTHQTSYWQCNEVKVGILRYNTLVCAT